jgi:hypothetical protein
MTDLLAADAKNEKFMISNFEGLDDGGSEEPDAPAIETFEGHDI